jgi:hypothetical protein
MSNNSHAAERSSVEFIVFGLGFVGFIISASGIIVDSAPAALTGGLVLIAAVAFFSS